MSYVWEPIKNEDIKWWGVDFDDTICYNSGFPDFIPTNPLPKAVEALKLIESLGYKITIFTARPWSNYTNIENWCKHYGVPFRRIICGKPLVHTMYDDRNWGTKINWQEVIDFYSEPVDNLDAPPEDDI